jgi:hypothetical protein
VVEKIKKIVRDQYKEKLNVMEKQIDKIDEDRVSLERKGYET